MDQLLYCNRCGAYLPPESPACVRCGQVPVSSGPPCYDAQMPPTAWGYYAPIYDPAAAARRNRRTNVRVVVLVVLAIAALALGAYAVGRDDARREYRDLQSRICQSETPAQVAGYLPDLEYYETRHGGQAAEELSLLVRSCYQYTIAEEGAQKYEALLQTLGGLASGSGEVAECARHLLPLVAAAYEDYSYYGEGERPGGPDFGMPSPEEDSPWYGDDAPYFDEDGLPLYPSAGEMTTPMQVEGSGLGEIQGAPGQQSFSFTATNIAGKDIEYFEVMVYCYDRQGRPIAGENGYCWEWRNASVAVPAEGPFTPQSGEWWGFENFHDVAYVVPWVTYARFTDGTTWGLTEPQQEVTTNIIVAADNLQVYADVIVWLGLTEGP